MEARCTAVYRQPLAGAAYLLGKLCPVRPRTVAEGVAVCVDLARHDLRSTLGKFSTARDAPTTIVDEYCLASRSVQAAGVAADRFHLSIKLPALAFDVGRAWDVVALTWGAGYGAHFDSHGHDVAPPTFNLLDNLIGRGHSSADTGSNWLVSVTLPSRWRRSAGDARWAIERGTRVRLVKGEFKASNRLDETDPAASFLTLVDLLAGKVPALAIATHDVGLACNAVARCRDSGSSIELELLYRFPAGSMIALARNLDIPIRLYVPYGDQLFVYGARHLLTNPHKLVRGNYLRAWFGRPSFDLDPVRSPKGRPPVRQ